MKKFAVMEMKKFAVIIILLTFVFLSLCACDTEDIETTRASDTTGPETTAETEPETTAETQTEPDPVTVTERETTAETTAETSVVTSVGTSVETEPETTEEPPFRIPQTDTEWIDYLIDSMAATCYTKDKWERLCSYGEAAFDHLVTRYFDGEKDKAVRSIISVFAAQTLKDEVTKLNSPHFSNYYFPDVSDLEALKSSNISTWLSTFKIKAQSYGKYTVKEDALAEAPLVCRLLSLIGFDDYKFDPSRETVESCINKLASKNVTEVFDHLVYYRKYETIEYCAKHYFEETDKKRRVVMSWLTFRCMRYEEGLSELIGRELFLSFYAIGNGTYVSDGNYKSYPDIVEPILEKYAEAAKKAAQNKYKEEMQLDYPGTYAFLTALGFDNYKKGEPDIAFQVRPLLKDLNSLYAAVTYGAGIYDDTSEWFSQKEYTRDGVVVQKEYSAALKEKIEKYWTSERWGTEYPSMITQRQGLKTIDEWYSYYSAFLPADLVKGFIKESRNFIICDGVVYTPDEGYIAMWTTEIETRTARVVEVRDGYTVVGFSVIKGGHMAYEKTEFTVNVKEKNGKLYITGGTFIDRYMKNDIKTAAADELHTILLMHALYYNDNPDVFPTTRYDSYDSLKNLPDDVREYYKQFELPFYSNNLDYEIHWDDYLDFDITEYANGFYSSNGYTYSFIIPSAATVKNTPAFCSENEKDLSVYSVYNAMKNVSVKDGKITFSLDFVREENGKSKKVSYTFEFEYVEGKSYIRLTGGTFLEEVLKRIKN